MLRRRVPTPGSRAGAEALVVAGLTGPSVCVVRQSLLASIRHFQQKLLDNHERSKTVTRSADMQTIRNQMQARCLLVHCLLVPAVVFRKPTFDWCWQPSLLTLRRSGVPECRMLVRVRDAALRSKLGRTWHLVRGAETHCRADMQADINEVNKTAHTIKSRLEALDNANKKAITQPVRAAPIVSLCAGSTAALLSAAGGSIAWQMAR